MKPPELAALDVALRVPTVVLSGADGDVDAARDPAAGVYHGNVRVLSRLVLQVEGASGVRRDRAVDAGLVREVVSVAEGPATVRFTIATDLAGIDDVRAGRVVPAQEPTASDDGDGGLSWANSTLEVTVRAAGAVLDPVAGTLAWHPTGPADLVLEIRVTDRSPLVVAPSGPPPWTAPEVPASLDPRLVRWVATSMDDLDRLRLATPEHPDEQFLAAGAPWYFTLFGRDSLWAARMLLPLGHRLADGTLAALARRQGSADDPLTEEQRGKILHELRRDALVLGDGLRIPPVYYGTVDATPLWVCLLREAVRAGLPDPERFRAPLERSLGWIERSLADGGGWLRYVDSSGHGLANQGWKDSPDAVRHLDGRLAKAPVALAEVQGYAYQALTAGAALLDALSGARAGDRFRDLADDLAARFRRAFWVVDSAGFYPAMALDADDRPADALASNIGHLLGTGLLDADEVDAVALRLTDPALDGGFGLRTLASTCAGYDPLSYHCGSVWPHDTAIAVAGLAREGLTSLNRRGAFERLVEGLLAASEAFDARVPELWAGDSREDPVTGAYRAAPRPYPSACRPQAWSAAASVSVLDAVLSVAGRAGTRAPG